MTEREGWEKTWLVAEVWYCGDEECDCHQAIIYRRTPNREAGFPWVKRSHFWNGRFVTEPTAEELEAVRQELRDAAAKYGITLDDNLLGRREE